MEVQKITLTRSRARTVINTVQGDSESQKLVFTLLNAQGERVQFTSDHHAAFYVNRCQGGPVQVAGEVNTGNGTVTVVLPMQASAVPGNHVCTLQVYSTSEDLWRGDMVLSVARNPACDIAAGPEFQPLTEILQKSAEISQAAYDIKSTYDITKEILDRNTNGTCLESSGRIQREEPEGNVADGSCIAYDTAGALLWLDGHNPGGTDTKVSFDDGQNWIDAPIQSSEASDKISFEAVIGGDKFLLYSKSKIMWATAENGALTVGTPITNPLQSNTSPSLNAARYINGKYWIFRNEGSTVYPPAFFTGNGGNYTIINLPGSGMMATDIAYNEQDATYYMVGCYSAYIGGETKAGWLIKSQDLQTWETVKTWERGRNEGWAKYRLSLRDGVANAIIISSAGLLEMYRIRLDAGSIETVSVNGGDNFLPYAVAQGSIVDVVVGQNGGLATTKDGVTFALQGSLDFTGYESCRTFCDINRIHVAVTRGPLYRIYRVDTIGSYIQDIQDSMTFTEDEISFIKHPYRITTYVGSGSSTRTFRSLPGNKVPYMILGLCQEHPPCVPGTNGTLNVYWDFWLSAGNNINLGGGGILVDEVAKTITVKNGAKALASAWTPCTRNLNANGALYVLLLFYNLPTA